MASYLRDSDPISSRIYSLGKPLHSLEEPQPSLFWTLRLKQSATVTNRYRQHALACWVLVDRKAVLCSIAWPNARVRAPSEHAVPLLHRLGEIPRVRADKGTRPDNPLTTCIRPSEPLEWVTSQLCDVTTPLTQTATASIGCDHPRILIIYGRWRTDLELARAHSA